MESMMEGDTVNLQAMIDEGFVPHRWDYKTKTNKPDDRLDYFSSMSDGMLDVRMIHPDGRILYYGLLHAGKPPGYIWSNYMKTILWKGYEQRESS